MKISMNHLIPLERLDYRNDNSNLVLKILSQHYDHDTNYILPLQVDGLVIQVLTH